MADPGQIQPLYPEDRVTGPLLQLAAKLVAECHRLGGQAGEPAVRALRPKLRAMNSYYTNKIEGQHSSPGDIERAVRREFDADAALAKKQRLALAHMEVEQQLEEKQATPRDLFDRQLVREIHGLLYGKLPEGDRITDEGRPIVPGDYRRDDVAVGRHVAPPWKDIDDLLNGWADRYRSLARTHEQYYARLSNADLSRRNDLDGRGPLSQEELVAFARYFLEICLDQVRFMRERLALASLKDRLKALLLYLRGNSWRIGSEKSIVKLEALEALHYVAMTGPVDRSRFIAMTGLGERTGRRVLASLLDYGVLSAESSRSPVAFTVPLKSLKYLFPNLWPEAEVE